MKYLLTMVCLLAMFSSCSNDNNDTPDTQAKGCTVLVYISAENTLSDYADENIRQMVEGSMTLTPENHLIAFIDKASATEMPYIVEFSGGEQKIVKTYTEDICASDPREMRDIIKWTAENYPAKDYGLILWGHASGWLIEDSVATRSANKQPQKAFGIDNGKNTYSDSGKWMNTPSMAKYIAESGIKFKYIFADVCCFQNVENVYELRDVTDYLIGSPAEIPADGAPYDAIMPYLFSTSNDFYKGIIDEYEAYYSTRSYGGEIYSVPLSAAKTSEAVSLAQTAQQLWSQMPLGDISTKGVIYYFSKYSVAGKGYDPNKIFYDAFDIVWQNADEAVADSWHNALNDMIVYSSFNTDRHWMTAGHVSFSDFTVTPERISCISMFVPLAIYESGSAQYNEMIKQMAWYYASGLCDYQ